MICTLVLTFCVFTGDEVDVSALLDERLDHVRGVLGDGVVKRGAVAPGLRAQVHVRAGIDQERGSLVNNSFSI